MEVIGLHETVGAACTLGLSQHVLILWERLNNKIFHLKIDRDGKQIFRMTKPDSLIVVPF